MLFGSRLFQERAYRKKFLKNKDENLFIGSFENFAAAQASAPSCKLVGYDNPEAAMALYSHQIYFYDYPALFWLGQSLDFGYTRIFDLGGHIGIKYYAFRRVLRYPATLRWVVCDLPCVVQAGIETALQRNVAQQLEFTTALEDASGCHVLYASGSLQYLPIRIGEIVRSLKIRPKRILLNITAVHSEQTIYTLNSMSFAVCPYRIQHHDELLSELHLCGYKRRDSWRNEGKTIKVPFVKGGDTPYYAGGCYDLAN